MEELVYIKQGTFKRKGRSKYEPKRIDGILTSIGIEGKNLVIRIANDSSKICLMTFTMYSDAKYLQSLHLENYIGVRVSITEAEPHVKVELDCKSWLEYYWRSLFYSIVDTREEKRGAQLSLNFASFKEKTELSREELSKIVKPAKGVALKDNYTIAVSPFSLGRKEDGKNYHYFPFWFFIQISRKENEENWKISVPNDFHIFVHREFLTPICSLEENCPPVFTDCKLFEANYQFVQLKDNNDLKAYYSFVENAFKNMTNKSVDRYTCKPFRVNRKLSFRVEGVLYDYSKYIRSLYNSIHTEKTPLLRSLFSFGSNAVKADGSLSRLHFGQMDNHFPLSASQRKALNVWLSNEKTQDIMVVNGPPGTGKTTMIRSVVASKIVESALNDSPDKQGKPFIALCCASTNQAVTNIIDSFSTHDGSDSVHWISGDIGYATYCYAKNRKEEAKDYTRMYVGEKQIASRLPGAEYKIIDKKTKARDSYIVNAQSYYGDEYEDIEKIKNRIHEDLVSTIDLIKTFEDQDRDKETLWNTIMDAVGKDNHLVIHKDYLSEGMMSFATFDNVEGYEERIECLLDVTYRYKAFQLAVRYWEARWLLAADESKSRKKGKEEKQNELTKMAMLTPCLVSTIHSAVRLMAYMGKELVPLYSFADYLIFDEAGQTLPELGVAPFAFANKALIFGDAEQLKPIYSFTEGMDKGNLEISKACDADGFDNCKPYGWFSSTGNMVNFCQSSCNIYDENNGFSQKGVLLREHRRCRKEIIDYCNLLVYHGNLDVLTVEQNDYLFKPFMFIPIKSLSHYVEGTRSKVNDEEAEAIVSWLFRNKKKIESHYKTLYGKQKTLGNLVAIVTPFASQAEKIKETIKTTIETKYLEEIDKRLGKEAVRDALEKKNEKEPYMTIWGSFNSPFEGMVIDTVHSLQGAQSDIVIFSSVYGSEDKDMSFIDMDNTMLNVAVSRAKHSFIVFGNPDRYHDSALKYYLSLNTSGEKSFSPKCIPTALLKAFCNKYDDTTPYMFDRRILDYLDKQGRRIIREVLDSSEDTYSDCEPLLEIALVAAIEKRALPVSKETISRNVELKNVDQIKQNIDNLTDCQREYCANHAHFDFLVSTESKVLAIEVDGVRHEEEDRKKNDFIKDTIAKDSGIEMLRIKTSTNDSEQNVIKIIKKRLSE
ncbi:MAG: AAA domain-containing protein [Bacteroidales bacterium]|nr:AAA domain-containing protein [Bacteroidales bacterium]